MMRSFWGVVLLVIGLLFLGINFGWLNSSVWSQIWQLWPLLLIAWGLRSLLHDDKSYILSVLILLALGLVLAVTMPRRPLSTRFDGMKHAVRWDFDDEKLSGEQATFDQSVSPEVALTDITLDFGSFYDITVVGGDTNTIAANLSGPKELIDQLAFSGEDTSSVSFGDTGSNGVLFTLLNHNQKVTGTVTVPSTVALSLKLSGVSTVNLKNLQSNLIVKSSGTSQIRTENTVSVDPWIELSGAGKVTLDDCKGNALVILSGAGKIDFNNCTLDKLTLKASGAGDVDMTGTLKDLEVNISGAGKVKVPQPTGTTQQDISGAGKLNYQ